MNTKTKQEHKKTPWTLEGFKLVYKWGALSANDEAFIVSAVNSHEELLEACKLALKAINSQNMMELFLANSKLKEVITKAEANAER